jgi:hypothetical protein
MNMTKLILAGLAGLIFLNSCTQYQAQGAGVGALAGGALGAIAGNDRRDVLRGAALGAAVGTGVAAVQESERQKAATDAEYYRGGQNRDSGYDSGYSDPAPSRQTSRQDYPVAERTENPDRVISPYGPNYNVIDVSGFRSGQLARDPSNQKIFRVP